MNPTAPSTIDSTQGGLISANVTGTGSASDVQSEYASATNRQRLMLLKLLELLSQLP